MDQKSPFSALFFPLFHLKIISKNLRIQLRSGNESGIPVVLPVKTLAVSSQLRLSVILLSGRLSLMVGMEGQPLNLPPCAPPTGSCEAWLRPPYRHPLVAARAEGIEASPRPTFCRNRVAASGASVGDNSERHCYHIPQ